MADKIRSPLGSHEAIVAGFSRGFIVPGFLRWCRTSSTHNRFSLVFVKEVFI